MKYYSELTKSFYDSEAECLAAEAKRRALEIKLAEQKKKKEEEKKREEEKKKYEQKKLSEDKTRREKEIEDARIEMNKSSQKYMTLLGDFLRDYGTFHRVETALETNPFMKFFGDFLK